MTSGSRSWATFVVIAIGIGALAGLVWWGSPRLSVVGSNGPASSNVTFVDGRFYATETHELFGSGVPAWVNFTFMGVVFGFHFWCGPPTPGGGVVCGNSTEANGTVFSYAFPDGPPQVSPQWQTVIAPDGLAGVQYMQGGEVRLLVEVALHPP